MAQFVVVVLFLPAGLTYCPISFKVRIGIFFLSQGHADGRAGLRAACWVKGAAWRVSFGRVLTDGCKKHLEETTMWGLPMGSRRQLWRGHSKSCGMVGGGDLIIGCELGLDILIPENASEFSKWSGSSHWKWSESYGIYLRDTHLQLEKDWGWFLYI